MTGPDRAEGTSVLRDEEREANLHPVADHAVTLPLAAVLAGWRDGDENGWQVEFDRLRSDPVHAARVDMLASSIQQDGIRLPILLGSDGRVWDGHHRLCAADMLALSAVPCEFADPAAVVVRAALPGTADTGAREAVEAALVDDAWVGHDEPITREDVARWAEIATAALAATPDGHQHAAEES